MGDVYLGVRDDGSFRKEVAIKVARDVYSAEQQHRFLRERELLARLEHPAIAHVLDGGSTASGQPRPSNCQATPSACSTSGRRSSSQRPCSRWARSANCSPSRLRLTASASSLWLR